MRVLLGSFALSLALNAAMYYSADHVFFRPETPVQVQKRLALLEQKKSKDALQFEFVEAPHQIAPEPPRENKKISNRNSVNQDMEKIKPPSYGGPKLENIGPTDQLQQNRNNAAAAAQASARREARRAQRQSAASKAAPAPKPEEAPKPKEASSQSGKEEIVEIPRPVPPQPSAKESAAQQAQKPQTPSPAASAAANPAVNGRDKISTQAMTKTQSTGAHLFGMTSFEATGSGMGEYMKNLKEKIWLSWYPYLAFKYPMDFHAADAVISFVLDKEGNVKIVKILESSGSPLFAGICMESVQRASGFGAIPKELLAISKREELEIKFGFHYR